MNILGFEYPDDLYYHLERDMWARRLENGWVQVGPTAFGMHISGNVYMCRPKSVGTELAQGRAVAIVELPKAVMTVKSPVTGIVREINALLEDRPGYMHEEPYGRGWVAIIEPTQWESDLAQLHHGAGLAAAAEKRMRLEHMDFSQGTS